MSSGVGLSFCCRHHLSTSRGYAGSVQSLTDLLERVDFLLDLRNPHEL